MASAKMLAVAALVFLLLGCVSTTYSHRVLTSGDSELKVMFNASKMKGMAGLVASFGNASGSLNWSEEFEVQMQKFCENYTAVDPAVQCTHANEALTLSKSFSLAEDAYGFSAQNFSGEGLQVRRYTFTLERLPNITAALAGQLGNKSVGGQSISFSGMTDLKFTDPRAKTEAEKASLTMSLKYVVEMPGLIVSADGADSFSGGRAVFDVFKMMKAGRNIVVVSEEKEGLPAQKNEEEEVGQGIGLQQPSEARPAPAAEQGIAPGPPIGVDDNWAMCGAAALLLAIAIGVSLLGFLRMLGPPARRDEPDIAGERRTKIVLVDYVRKHLAKGHSPEKIKKALLDAGWDAEDVDAALRVCNWYGGPPGMY